MVVVKATTTNHGSIYNYHGTPWLQNILPYSLPLWHHGIPRYTIFILWYTTVLLWYTIVIFFHGKAGGGVDRSADPQSSLAGAGQSSTAIGKANGVNRPAEASAPSLGVRPGRPSVTNGKAVGTDHPADTGSSDAGSLPLPAPTKHQPSLSGAPCLEHFGISQQFATLSLLKQQHNGDTSVSYASEVAKGRWMHVQAVLGTQPCTGSNRPISDQQTVFTYRFGWQCVRFGRPAVISRGWPVVPVGLTCALSKLSALWFTISGVWQASGVSDTVSSAAIMAS